MKKDLITDYLKLFGAFTTMGIVIGLIVLLSKIYSASENLYVMLGYFPAIGILFGIIILSVAYAAGRIVDMIDKQS